MANGQKPFEKTSHEDGDKLFIQKIKKKEEERAGRIRKRNIMT